MNNIDDIDPEWKQFVRSKAKDRMILVGVILFGIFSWFGSLYAAAALSHKATVAATHMLGLPQTGETK